MHKKKRANALPVARCMRNNMTAKHHDCESEYRGDLYLVGVWRKQQPMVESLPNICLTFHTSHCAVDVSVMFHVVPHVPMA